MKFSVQKVFNVVAGLVLAYMATVAVNDFVFEHPVNTGVVVYTNAEHERLYRSVEMTINQILMACRMSGGAGKPL